MLRGLQFSIFVILGVALSAFTSGNAHNLMNASSGPVVLDIRSSRDQPITHFRLTPGHSVGFNGLFQHLRVRMVSGKMLTFSERQLIQLHGDSVPTRGGWLVEDSGVRSVSSRDYNLAYRRFHKVWPKYKAPAIQLWTSLARQHFASGVSIRDNSLPSEFR